MADERDRPSTLAKAPHLSEALPLEGGIADCENLVDDQDFGVKVGGHRKSQADIHAGGVALDGRVEKLFNSRELDDLVEFADDLGAGHAQDSTVKEDVLPPGEFLMKSGADLDEAGGPAIAAYWFL